ncbi:glycosyltransferase [Geminisphaera colitermitum]|uniref:glycosyltransferase n=1 Tax=Geminisphaera colitermitum TaxID=1148786 RepID=UPI0001965015|nr:glycosyltransferase [Geminisphaera colitermitum]
MARIRIYIARHLCTAPRPQKEADALALAGHDVSVHGMAYRADFAARDASLAAGKDWAWEPVVNFATPPRRFAWLRARLRHRLAREWFAITTRISADVWGYANHALAAHALRQPANLTIVHFEGGLWFGESLLQRGLRVGVDFEDWFSHDLAPSQRHGRPVGYLAQLETRFLRSTPYALAPSRSLAEAMSHELDAPPPSVIYNTFSAGPEPVFTTPPQRPVSLHWFSLVMGPERGLETLFDALPAVHGFWELHLRGESTPAYRQSLLSRLAPGLHSRIHFLPTVSAGELPAAIAAHDIGLALEVSAIPSRNLTITNKFFHYLQSGLAVVASDTAGHREGLSLAPGAGNLFTAGQPDSLARALNHWTTNPARITPARLAARAAFVSRLSHDHQCTRYAALAAAALA